MKTLIKLTLVLSLFGSAIFADGDMGTGGYQCPPEGCTPPPCTINCGFATQAGGEGDSMTTSETIFVATDLAIDLVADMLNMSL